MKKYNLKLDRELQFLGRHGRKFNFWHAYDCQVFNNKGEAFCVKAREKHANYRKRGKLVNLLHDFSDQCPT